MPKPSVSACWTCGKPVEQQPIGQLKRYCNDTCRRRHPNHKERLIKWGNATYQKAYREANKERVQGQKRLASAKVRTEGILHYGGRCTCCGESDHRFLSMEHINGKRGHPVGRGAWYRARAMGWPDSLTILCHNCNQASGIYGRCPHKEGVND